MSDDRGMRNDIDAAVIALAQRQHGAFGHRQVYELGGDRHLVQRRVQAGRWVRLTHAALVQAATEVTWRTVAMAAVLSTPDSMISGRSAALLHDLGPYRRVGVEVTAPFAANARGVGYVVRRCRHFDDIESTLVDGFPVMTPAELIHDLARREPRALVQRILEEAIVQRKASLDEVRALTGRRQESRCPGAGPVARILLDLDGTGVSESELERALGHLLKEMGVSGIDRQASVPWRSPVIGRVDVSLPSRQIILEADGRRWHSRERDFERDRARDNEAVANGWRVLRFTYRMLRDDSDGCAGLIRAALGA
jgi:very-short-patch-repair endonuclease